MAAMLGKKGGSKRTPAQTAARKKNMRKALNVRLSKFSGKAA